MPKDGKWDTDYVEWFEGWTLYVKDPDLAKKVYDAMYRTRSFRVIVDGAVVCSYPKNIPGSHSTADTVVWSSKDMEWDSAGCLIIKDKKLGKLVVEAHENGDFYIVMDKNAISGTGGPIGGEKVNAMCAC